jgi:hypothetical protein
MAHATIEQFDETTTKRMRGFFKTLTEKDKRRFAAIEAQRLGRGGIIYISKVLGCSTRTISRGIEELDQLPDDPAAGRVRRLGAGRKKRSRPAPTLKKTCSRSLKHDPLEIRTTKKSSSRI